MLNRIVLAALVLGLACGQASPAARAETVKVAAAQKGLWDTSIVVWGERAGFFRKEGLELEILYTEGGAETQQAVIAGGVEFGIGAGTLGVISAAVRGAPVRAFAAEWQGASDLFWYVKTADPIRSLKDAGGKTIGFSTVGSSSQLVLLDLLKAAGVQAKPIPTGGPAATMTQLMSGQIDIGWTVASTGITAVEAGQTRIVARGTDNPALSRQTTRVNIVNANYLKAHRDVVARFARAYLASLDWAYSDPRALAWFAEGLALNPALAKRVRDEFYLRAAMQPDTVQGIDVLLQQALELKRVPAGTTLQQAQAAFDLVEPAR